METDPNSGILNPSLQKYLKKLLRPREKVLSYLERDAERNFVPIIGPLCGNLLALVAMSCHARNILELGTATGYSGLWLARVAELNSGRLTTIEIDPVRRKIARKAFEDAGLADSVSILPGDAREIVPRISKRQKGKFDVVLMDVDDKVLYLELYEDCVRALRTGGFLLADNALRNGLVATSRDKSQKTRIMRKLNRLVYADKRLFPVIVPLRDGVIVALKVGTK